MCYNIDIMEKGHWKIVVLVLIFLGLVGAGTLAIYQKLKLPTGEQAELSKIETAELEKPKQESENTEPKKNLKRKSLKGLYLQKRLGRKHLKKSLKYLRQKRVRFRLNRPSLKNLQWESPLPIGIKKLSTGP